MLFCLTDDKPAGTRVHVDDEAVVMSTRTAVRALFEVAHASSSLAPQACQSVVSLRVVRSLKREFVR